MGFALLLATTNPALVEVEIVLLVTPSGGPGAEVPMSSWLTGMGGGALT